MGFGGGGGGGGGLFIFGGGGGGGGGVGVFGVGGGGGGGGGVVMIVFDFSEFIDDVLLVLYWVVVCVSLFDIVCLDFVDKFLLWSRFLWWGVVVVFYFVWVFLCFLFFMCIVDVRWREDFLRTVDLVFCVFVCVICCMSFFIEF